MPEAWQFPIPEQRVLELARQRLAERFAGLPLRAGRPSVHRRPSDHAAVVWEIPVLVDPRRGPE